MQVLQTRDWDRAGYRGEMNTRAQDFGDGVAQERPSVLFGGGLSPFKLCLTEQAWQAVAMWKIYEKKNKQVSQVPSLTVTHFVRSIHSPVQSLGRK